MSRVKLGSSPSEQMNIIRPVALSRKGNPNAFIEDGDSIFATFIDTVYIGKGEEKSPVHKLRLTRDYRGLNKGALIGISGCTSLNNALAQATPGNELEVVYNGLVTSKKGNDTHAYDVYDLTQEAAG